MKFKLSTAKKLLEYIDAHPGEQIAISDLAFYALVPQSNARYLIDLLIKQGKLVKVPIKTYNSRFIRYTYKRIVVEQPS